MNMKGLSGKTVLHKKGPGKKKEGRDPILWGKIRKGTAFAGGVLDVGGKAKERIYNPIFKPEEGGKPS